MTADQLRRSYQNFFIKDTQGQHFMETLNDLIKSEHEAAESNPELSRDHTQRAKGIRIVIEHITSVSAERKKAK
jgi:hypothetical protein